jgi:hypothetical protein
MRPNHYNNAYRDSLKRKINRLAGQVFSRDDLSRDRSNREQLRLNRALNTFAKEGFLIKISHGLYAKAKLMTFPNGKTKPVLQESFEDVAIEALNKLDLKWEFGRAIQEYNAGKTTQVPTALTVRLKSRFRGTISAEGRSILFEDHVNAR